MVKTDSLGVRVDPEIKKRLAEAARAERRSVSSLIELICEDWLNQQYPVKGKHK